MDNHTVSFIYLALWFLLPIIPAFILFKTLPGEAWAVGPFKGLKINFSGAFAAYLVLFLCAMPVLSKLLEVARERSVIWHVSGKVTREDGRPIPVGARATISFVPHPGIENGSFNFNIVGERQDAGAVFFPDIQIAVDGYQPATLDALDYLPGSSAGKSKWTRIYRHHKAVYADIALIDTNTIASLSSKFVTDEN